MKIGLQLNLTSNYNTKNNMKIKLNNNIILLKTCKMKISNYKNINKTMNKQRRIS